MSVTLSYFNAQVYDEVRSDKHPIALSCGRGVRLHDLRHTAATLWLSSGVHFMQVSKWLGHSTYTLTLDVYGDWIPEDDGGAVNPLPEPTAPVKSAEQPSNVVKLFGRRAN